MNYVLQEARVVLPGIQALFGFQTVVVFNERFHDLPVSGVWLHLASLILTTLAIALIMSSAAYHRMAGSSLPSQEMVRLASRLVSSAMVPLMCSLALDVFVVVLGALDDAIYAAAGGSVVFIFLLLWWFVFPLARRRRRAKS